MPAMFQGLPQGFFDFFEELSRNNERAWFTENKARYEAQVLAPLSAFVEAMAPCLDKISPHYVADPRPRGGSIFRIHRDMRFARGGKPHKENAGVHFRHEAGKDAHAPGFYVHIETGRIFFGGGIWKPPAPELKKIRERIATRTKDWSAVIGDRALKRTFGGVGGVDGEALTRPPRGFDPEHPHIEDIKRKTYFLIREAEPALAQSPKFLGEVEKAFKAATPMMRFICKALDVRF